MLTILVIVIILALLGAFPIHTRYGVNGTMGWVGALILIVVVLYLLGVVR